MKSRWIDELGRSRVTLGPPSPTPDHTLRQLAPEETPAAWEAERTSMMAERGVGRGYRDNFARSILHDPDSEAANSVHREAAKRDEQLRTELRALNHSEPFTPHFGASDNMWQRFDPRLYQERAPLPRIVDNDDVRVASLEQHTVPRASGGTMPGFVSRDPGPGANSHELSAADNFKVLMDRAYHDVKGFIGEVEDRLRAIGASAVAPTHPVGERIDDDVRILQRKSAATRAHSLADLTDQGRGLQNNTLQPDFRQIDYNQKPGLRHNPVDPRHDRLQNDTLQPEFQGIEHKSRELQQTFVERFQTEFSRLFYGTQLEHKVSRDLVADPALRVDHGTGRALDGRKLEHKSNDLKAKTDIATRAAATQDMGREQDYTRGFLAPTKADRDQAAVIPGLVGAGERHEAKSHGSSGELVRAY